MNSIEDNDFEELEIEEEIEEEKPFWKKILFNSLKILTALILIAGVFYIYGGLRELFLFSETSPTLNEVEVERKVEERMLTLPLNIIILRSKIEGSQRSREDIDNMVENASKIWNQGAINFSIYDVREVDLDDSDLNNFLTDYRNILMNLEEYESDMVNVVLKRRLSGINGIAFSGLNTVVVADLTTVYDFRVLAHEIGHILGLGHVEVDDRLMHQGANSFNISLEEIEKARSSLDEFLD